jgi:cytochrome c5
MNCLNNNIDEGGFMKRMKKVGLIVMPVIFLIATIGMVKGGEHGSTSGIEHGAQKLQLSQEASAATSGSEVENPGELLFEKKCSVCHFLIRALEKSQDQKGWTETVKRMQGLRGHWISDDQAKIIIDYLVEQNLMIVQKVPEAQKVSEAEKAPVAEKPPEAKKAPVPKKAPEVATADVTGDPGKLLFENKCSMCHFFKRALDKKKDQLGWTETIGRMQRTSGNRISDEEANAIIAYLLEVRGPWTLKLPWFKK